jgi:hypothetical protein
MRDQLLRASYWLDAALRAWETSKSLSYGAAINAIETLMPKQKADPCPTCSRDRSPGPTAGFRDFVETYAASEGAEARDAMYRFRSALVHGHRLHSMDLPSPWGALVPGEIEHRELHSTAFAVARTAVLTWFLNPTATAETQSHEVGSDQTPPAAGALTPLGEVHKVRHPDPARPAPPPPGANDPAEAPAPFPAGPPRSRSLIVTRHWHGVQLTLE